VHAQTVTLGLGVAINGQLFWGGHAQTVAVGPWRQGESDARELETVMAIDIEVATKDCTALTDAELAEMADLSAGERAGWEVGFLSKQREEWVLVTQVRGQGRLLGYALATLERIGGTPSLLIGVATFTRGPEADAALDGAMRDLYRRAVLAFPDEDVLVGTRFARASGFRSFAGLEDIVPRPEHRATGEERAWGRRLAKRFGADGNLDDRAFVLKGDGDAGGLLDFDPQAPPPGCEPLECLFAVVDAERRDSLVAFGWAMAEALAASTLPL
jgi:hypothetical protein